VGADLVLPAWLGSDPAPDRGLQEGVGHGDLGEGPDGLDEQLGPGLGLGGQVLDDSLQEVEMAAQGAAAGRRVSTWSGEADEVGETGGELAVFEGVGIAWLTAAAGGQILVIFFFRHEGVLVVERMRNECGTNDPGSGGGFAVGLQQQADIGVNVGVDEEGLKIGGPGPDPRRLHQRGAFDRGRPAQDADV